MCSKIFLTHPFILVIIPYVERLAFLDLELLEIRSFDSIKSTNI
jgi:hypothetical protein